MRKSIICLAIILLIIASENFSLASGFSMGEQSAKGMGIAFSGGAASALDSSTVFFNPAGMARLEGKQLSTGVNYAMPTANYSCPQCSIF